MELKYLDRLTRDKCLVTEEKLRSYSRRLNTLTNYELNELKIYYGILDKNKLIRKVKREEAKRIAKFFGEALLFIEDGAKGLH